MEFLRNAKLHDIARPSTELVKEICDRLNFEMRCLNHAWLPSQWGTRPTRTEMRIRVSRASAYLDLLFRLDYITVDDYSALHSELSTAAAAARERRADRLARA
jgi:hypothetical protein